MLSWGSIPNNPILHIKLWKSTLIHKDFQEWEKRKSNGEVPVVQSKQRRYRRKGGLIWTHKRLAQHFLPLGDYKVQLPEDPCASVLNVRGNCRNPLLNSAIWENHTTYCPQSKFSLGTQEMRSRLHRTATKSLVILIFSVILHMPPT